MNIQDFNNEMEKAWRHDTGDISVAMRNHIRHRLAYIVGANAIKDIWADVGFVGEPDLEYGNGAVYITDPQLEPMEKSDETDLFLVMGDAIARKLRIAGMSKVGTRITRPETAPERVIVQFKLPDDFTEIEKLYNAIKLY